MIGVCQDSFGGAINPQRTSSISRESLERMQMVSDGLLEGHRKQQKRKQGPNSLVRRLR